MAIDLSLVAVPKEMDAIFEKALQNSDSEYPDIIFSLTRAFETDFNDFGHPDWIAFKSDAQHLLQYYPNQEFGQNYFFDSQRSYGVLEYLFSKYMNSSKAAFFDGGFEFKVSKGGQGHSLKYWDIALLKQKIKQLQDLDYNTLIELYDFDEMSALGVYKIDQIHEQRPLLSAVFNDLKQFLRQALTLNGYVLIMRY